MIFTHMPTTADKLKYGSDLELLVKAHMMHHHTERCLPSNRPLGPQERCSFGFPHPPVISTYRDENGNWVTWRRGGDSMVASYCPQMLLDMRCHVYVVAISGTHAIGYLLQYPCKGDASVLNAIRAAHRTEDASSGGASTGHNSPTGVDEIGLFKSDRILSSGEAAFRVLEFPVITVHPPVHTIYINSPNDKFCMKRPGETLEAALARYHTSVEKFFGRPAAFENCNFRSYFDSVIIKPPDYKQVSFVMTQYISDLSVTTHVQQHCLSANVFADPQASDDIPRQVQRSGLAPQPP
jgi:hypothetical protein